MPSGAYTDYLNPQLFAVACAIATAYYKRHRKRRVTPCMAKSSMDGSYNITLRATDNSLLLMIGCLSEGEIIIPCAVLNVVPI